MAKEVKVTCDGCGRDITTRTNSVDYRLVLASESKPGYGSGVYTDMMIYPPIDHTHYFCGMVCLDLWTDRRRHYEALSRAWWDKWKDEHGTKNAEGRVISYPGDPIDGEEEREADWHAQSLAAFPMKTR